MPAAAGQAIHHFLRPSTHTKLGQFLVLNAKRTQFLNQPDGPSHDLPTITRGRVLRAKGDGVFFHRRSGGDRGQGRSGTCFQGSTDFSSPQNTPEIRASRGSFQTVAPDRRDRYARSIAYTETDPGFPQPPTNLAAPTNDAGLPILAAFSRYAHKTPLCMPAAAGQAIHHFLRPSTHTNLGQFLVLNAKRTSICRGSTNPMAPRTTCQRSLVGES